MDALDVEDLESLLVRVLEENAALRAEVAALREANRRLKGHEDFTARDLVVTAPVIG